MSKIRVLVVEDESIIAMDIVATLKKLGYEVMATVASGEQAIKKVEDNKPDLILMDIIIKGEMDGIETAGQIHSRFSIPVVYLTAYTDERTLERAKITGPFGYVTKPFQDIDLRVAVEIGLYKAKMDAERERLIQELQETLAKVNILSGLLPICAWCKKLRDNKGYWKSVEEYISAHTGAEFTHGMCPECQNKYFSEYSTEENSKANNNSKVS